MDREELEAVIRRVCTLSRMCEVGIGYWLVRAIASFTAVFRVSGGGTSEDDHTDKESLVYGVQFYSTS